MEEQLARPGSSETGVARDAAVELRQYELLLSLTTQLLSTQSLEERLSLALDTLAVELEFPCAAIALVNQRTSSLRMRMAVGFEDNKAIEEIDIPLDSAAASVSVIHERRPIWIVRGKNPYAPFMSKFIERTDILALPLFGPGWQPEAGSVEWAAGFEDAQRAPEETCLGALYVGANQNETQPSTYKLLLRFATHVGIAVDEAIEQERKVGTIRKLQLERQWIESIMKSVADPIVLTNLDNEILLQNRRAEELFSGSDNASEGKRRALSLNDLLFSAYLSSCTIGSSQPISRDVTLVDPIEGADLHFEVISTPALNVQGDTIGLVSVFRDVTDLRRANEELARNFAKLQKAEVEASRERDRLDLIIEHVGQPIVVTDPTGRFVLFNRRAEALFQVQESFEPGALAATRANSVKLTSFISGLASEPARSRQAEIELIDPASGKPMPMEIASVKVEEGVDHVTAIVSVLHDLTEIRELERRRVEQQLFESEKLAALGRLAAGIAHEVNNPLEAIKNSLYLLRSSQDPASTERFLNVAFHETERVSEIIRQMLGFARRSGDREWVDAHALLDDTLVLIEKNLQQSRVTVHRQFQRGLPLIYARQDQLRQVLLNLLLNAQQAIEKEGGRIRIRTGRAKTLGEPAIFVEISDTGCGIRPENLPRIFEPFFSTRKGGVGLGLWVCQDIIRRHAGYIEVSSVENKGTSFQIVLPIEAREAEEIESSHLNKDQPNKRVR